MVAEVIKEVGDVLFGGGGGCGLFQGNATEHNKCGDDDSLGIVHDGANNLLDAMDVLEW